MFNVNVSKNCHHYYLAIKSSIPKCPNFYILFYFHLNIVTQFEMVRYPFKLPHTATADTPHLSHHVSQDYVKSTRQC